MKTPINDGFQQSDLDADGHKITNADLSDYAGDNITWSSGTFNAAGGGGGGTASMTSNEVSVRVEVASAAATSAANLALLAIGGASDADAHANTVSARAVSISNELGSLLASASTALNARITSTSAALEAHINVVSAAGVTGGASVTSNELASLVQIASLAATSANTHANTVSARAVSISAELVSLMNSADAALSTRINTASALGTTADTHANTVSARAVSISNELGSLLASASTALNARITSVAGIAGGGSVTSTELSVAKYMVNTTQTDTDYTLVLADGRTTVKMSSSSPHNLTVPLNSSVAFPVGTQIVIEQAGTGAVTIVATGGVTLQGGPLTMTDQYATTVLIKQATDTWLVSGAIDVTSMMDALSAQVASADAALSLRVTSVAGLSGGGGGSATSAEVYSIVQGYSTFSIGATSVLLSAGSPPEEFATGSTGGTILMPDVTTLVLGKQYLVKNRSTTTVNVNSSGGNLIVVVTTGGAAVLTCILTTGTTAASWDYTMSEAAAVNTVSARVVSVSAELASLIQIASLAATSADTHANTVSSRAVSISNELGSLLASTSAALETHAVAASAAATSVGTKLASTEAHVDVVSARAVSISAELASLVNIASLAATSADAHANTVSVRAVSISNELGSLLASASLALNARITSVAGLAGTASITSQEASVLIQVASAAATSADAHANAVSIRAVSISNELGSLLASTSAQLRADITSVAGLVGGGGSATSAEIYSIVQGYSTFAASTVSVALSAGSPPEEFITGTAAQPIVMPVVTTLVLGKQYLIKNNSTASATVNSSGGNLIVTVPAGSAAVLTCILVTGTTAASWDYTMSGADVVSARLVSVSAELVSLMASADAALSTRINTASALGTTADTHANTVSTRAVSISAEVVSLMNSADAALSTRINTASALGTTADTHANTVSVRAVSISAELASLVNIASLAATSADAHANAVSARAVSVSNELGSLLASASTALNARITSVAGLVGGGSVTSLELMSTSAALEAHINAVSAAGTTGGASMTSNEISIAIAAGGGGEPFGLAQPYVFDSSTADSDPGSGKLRFNNASPGSATVIYIDLLNSSANDITPLIDWYGDGQEPYFNQIVVTKKSDPSVFASFKTIGGIVTGSGYRKLQVQAVAVSASTFTNLDEIVVDFIPDADFASGMISIDTRVGNNSSRMTSISNELGSLVASLSANLISKIAVVSLSANAISARVVSVSAELVSLLASSDAALSSRITSANTRMASVSAELYSVMQIASQNAQPNAYSIVLADAGKHIFHDSATPHTYIIPPNSTAAFPVGTMITVVNNTGGGTITLSILTDTLRRGDGTAGTGQRTIVADSVATVIKTKTTEWFITGKFT